MTTTTPSTTGMGVAMMQPLRYVMLLVCTCVALGCADPSPDEPPTDTPDTTQSVQPTSPADTSAFVTTPQDTARLDRLDAALRRLTAEVRGLRRTNDSLRDILSAASVPQSTAADTPADPDAMIDRARDRVQALGPRILMALVVLLLTYLVIRGTTWLLDVLAERNAQHRLFYKRLVPIGRIALWALALWFITRAVFGIEAQDLVVAAAAIGVAIGFAAQDILKNIFGGLVIIFDQPFQVGDKISVAGTYGEVVSIGLRSTRIVTPDDNLVSVPNTQVVDGQVANANAGALDCQVVTDLYLSGWTDESKAKKIAYEAAASSKYVYLDKPIVVHVEDEFDRTFVTHIKVKAYVLDTRYEFLFASDVTERARAGFREAGLLQPPHGARDAFELSTLEADGSDQDHTSEEES